MLHVHVNHGESDKLSMVSNHAKAYDRVFVAGEAAVQRHLDGLLEFDTSRLVRDRPAAARPAPPALLAPSCAADRPLRAHLGGRRRLQQLHVGRHLGVHIVRRSWPCPDVRVVYSRTRR